MYEAPWELASIGICIGLACGFILLITRAWYPFTFDRHGHLTIRTMSERDRHALKRTWRPLARAVFGVLFLLLIALGGLRIPAYNLLASTLIAVCGLGGGFLAPYGWCAFLLERGTG